MSLDGQPPGSVIAADARPRQLKVEAWASGAESEGLSRLELLRNGQTVQTRTLAPGTVSIGTNLPVSPSETGWYCVRIFGQDAKRQRAISGAFFLDAQPHPPPPPLESEVRVIFQDATKGEKLKGSLTEITFLGPAPRPVRQHSLADGEITLRVPGIIRLRADVPGYESRTKSLFLDNPSLVEFITHLKAEDLLDWKTFERVRELASKTTITFSLKPAQP